MGAVTWAIIIVVVLALFGVISRAFYYLDQKFDIQMRLICFFSGCLFCALGIGALVWGLDISGFFGGLLVLVGIVGIGSGLFHLYMTFFMDNEALNSSSDD